MKKYYFAGSQRIAMRIGSGTGTSGLKWLLGDHLGSTSVVAEGSSGARVAELRPIPMGWAKPWGELRYAYQVTPSDRRYTGQRSEGIGLYFYRSRWYDPQLGRFLSPDSIVPEPKNPIDHDRYAYANNNALKYIDPTGHWEIASADQIDREADIASPIADAIQAICDQMGCEGSNVDWIRIDSGFAIALFGYDTGIVQLPFHIIPGDPDERYPWEGAANVVYNEHRQLHPRYYLNIPAKQSEYNWFVDHWMSDASGIVQTMINRATWIGTQGEKFACYGKSVNSCAVTGGYASPHRNLGDVSYGEFYFLTFAVIELNVRVDQPYPYFNHQNRNSINGTGNESTAFGPTPGKKIHYVTPIPAYYE